MSRPSEGEEDSKRSLRKPPNYFSRAVQYRMLMLVGCLMMVVIAMIEARKPKYYQWLFPEEGVEQTGPIDTRLRPQEVAIANEDGPAEVDEDDDRQVDVVHQEEFDTWKKILSDLKAADRMFVYEALLIGRKNEMWSDANKQKWKDLAESFDESWKAYDSKAVDVVFEMSDDNPDKKIWGEVLHRLRTRWTEVKLLFDRISGNRPLKEKDAEVLASLELLFDEIALSSVKDRTFLNRPSESDAWFRILARTSAASRSQLEKKSVGDVGFLELFRQPKTYRGKVVTVKGTARLAYYVRAPKNIYNIRGYYIFIVKPYGGANSPLTIYALETPPGFPEISREQITLNDEVEFAGYFYKNRAYRAKGGSFISPTLVARVAKWEGTTTTVDAWAELPSVSTAVLGISGIAIVGVLICVLIYRQNLGVSPEVAKYEISNRTSKESLQKLEKEAPTVTIEDRLRNLAAAEYEANEEAYSDSAAEDDEDPEDA